MSGPSLYVREKSARLLATGAVTVCCADGELLAVIRGDHGEYLIRFGPQGLTCSCPAWRRPCSHETAVGLVVGGAR